MLLGEIAVGKTALARRLVFNRFDAGYRATLGVELYTHETDDIEAAGGPMRLSIWDVDGDLGESIASHNYIKGASGALIVADASREATLARLAPLAAVFREARHGRPALFVINKSDLIDAAGLERLRSHYDLDAATTLVTSAFDGANVAAAFQRLAFEIAQVGA